MFEHFGRMFGFTSRCQDHQSPGKRVGVGTSGFVDSSMSNIVGDVEVDNSDTVLQKLSKLYKDHLMSDITLVVGGTEYPAHRLILCASSEVFQVMLMNKEWTESKESKVELKESPACSKIFGDFLRYIYLGQIHINHLVVLPILALADKYNVKDLITLCVQYMCSHIAHAAANNQLVSWLQYTLNCGHYQVAKVCQNFVMWNLELVSKKSDFIDFEPDILISLLQQNDLVVHDEMTLYNCIAIWLEMQRERLSHVNSPDSLLVHMEQLVVALMSYIRFPMMSPRQLADLLLSPLTQAYKEFFMERMAIGMSFHYGQTDRVKEVLSREDGQFLFTPRLYTSDTWSTALCVDNFQQLPPYHARTLFFSSRAAAAEHSVTRSCEWVVDLYPKGVWFKKCYLIVWQGTVEVPEQVLRTVRLSVSCRDPQSVRARVGVLVRGQLDGIEHVAAVVQRCHRFSDKEPVLNFDDLLPFSELNTGPTGIPQQPSVFLVGVNRDILKVHIVIAPLSDECCLSPPPLFSL